MTCSQSAAHAGRPAGPRAATFLHHAPEKPLSTLTHNGQPAPRRDRCPGPPEQWGVPPVAPEQVGPLDAADPSGEFLHNLRAGMSPAEQLVFAQGFVALL